MSFAANGEVGGLEPRGPVFRPTDVFRGYLEVARQCRGHFVYTLIFKEQ